MPCVTKVPVSYSMCENLNLLHLSFQRRLKYYRKGEF